MSENKQIKGESEEKQENTSLNKPVSEEKEAKEIIKEFKMEETLVRPVKAASKDTSGKFVQKKKKEKLEDKFKEGRLMLRLLIIIQSLHYLIYMEMF